MRLYELTSEYQRLIDMAGDAAFELALQPADLGLTRQKHQHIPSVGAQRFAHDGRLVSLRRLAQGR